MIAFFALLGVSSPFLRSGWHSPTIFPTDFDFFFASREIARRVWAAGGSLDPWVAALCGGFPLLDSTDIPLLSPFVLLWQAIGAVPGAKWEYVLTLALGMWGMIRVGRSIAPRAPVWAIATGALHFVLCGFFLFHLNAGHISFAVFSLFSWVVYGYLERNPVYIALGLAAGPLLTCSNAIVHSGVLVLALTLLRPRWWKLSLQGGLGALALGAPVFAYHLVGYGEASAIKLDTEAHKEVAKSALQILRFLTQPSTNLWACDVDCYWEYGNYVGAPFLILATVGLIWGAIRRAELRLWAVMAVLFFLISMGNFAPWSPYRVFHFLPIFNRLDVNTRFLLIFTLALCVGWFALWDQVLGPKASRARLAAAALVCIGSIAPALVYAWAMFALPGVGPLLADARGVSADVREVHKAPDHRIGRYDALTTESGISNCHVASVRGTYIGRIREGEPALLSGPVGSSVRFDGRDWLVTGAGEVHLNQNFHPRLVATSGAEVVAHSGSLMAVRPTTGGSVATRVSLRPMPHLVAAWGVMLIAWGLLISQALFRRGKRRG